MGVNADKQQSSSSTASSQGGSKSADRSASQANAALSSARGKKAAAAFRTISEVADDLGVQQHVLRFWETKFTHIKPLKRGGGRRYYRPEDISLIKAIHHLLYVEGYTIKGVQKLFREVGKKQIVISFGGDNVEEGAAMRGEAATTPAGSKDPKLSKEQRETLQNVLNDLKELRGMMRKRN
ncbi:MAG: MerR family transcriptional regulator [Alphaproteobacteria bacterium]